jgi:hypothetical protein
MLPWHSVQYAGILIRTDKCSRAKKYVSLRLEPRTVMLTVLSDYVFVDEHNRHKRLKGKAVVRAKFNIPACLTGTSDESL